MKKRYSYDFDGMLIGEKRFMPCKKGDRDRVRNSLMASARAKKIAITTVITETGIAYTYMGLFVPKKEKGRVMNWHIGQEIVCVQSHSSGCVMKGNIYTIQGIRMKRCGCGGLQIDVGVKIPNKSGSGLYAVYCSACHAPSPTTKDNAAWFSERRFAPIVEADLTELLAILKTEMV